MKNTKMTQMYLEMKVVSFENLIEEYEENNAPVEAIELVTEAWDNYKLFEPLPDGSYNMQFLASDDNQQVIDTMENFGGYTWALLYAADFLYRNNVWSQAEIMNEKRGIDAFKNYIGSLSSIDSTIGITMIPDLNKIMWEYTRIKNGYYLIHRLNSISLYDSISWVSGRYCQYELFLQEKLAELSGEITTEQLAYLVYYKQLGDYIEHFTGNQIKILTEISKEYGKDGYKHLQQKYNTIIKQPNRQKGTQRNIDNLQRIKNLLSAFPQAIPHLQKDLIAAEINYQKTEGGKWKG